MNNHNDIFSNEFFSFISNFADTNPLELRLKMHGKEPDFDINDAICQIECRRKCRKKLSRFIQNEHFLFPSAIAAEQASHQAVGAYHAELISNGDNVLDMTAGLGIDSLSMSIKAASVKSCELDPHKAEILAHNSLALGCNNIEVITGDSVEFLKTVRIHMMLSLLILQEEAMTAADCIIFTIVSRMSQLSSLLF